MLCSATADAIPKLTVALIIMLVCMMLESFTNVATTAVTTGRHHCWGVHGHYDGYYDDYGHNGGKYCSND